MVKIVKILMFSVKKQKKQEVQHQIIAQAQITEQICSLFRANRPQDPLIQRRQAHPPRRPLRLTPVSTHGGLRLVLLRASPLPSHPSRRTQGGQGDRISPACSAERRFPNDVAACAAYITSAAS
jgi:hypothetical protein